MAQENLKLVIEYKSLLGKRLKRQFLCGPIRSGKFKGSTNTILEDITTVKNTDVFKNIRSKQRCLDIVLSHNPRNIHKAYVEGVGYISIKNTSTSFINNAKVEKFTASF